MAQSANGFQTGLTVFPSAWRIIPTYPRTKRFNALGGVAGNVGITWSVGAGALGSVDASGLYTAPNSVSTPSVDQILATAADGSQAQALVYLS